MNFTATMMDFTTITTQRECSAIMIIAGDGFYCHNGNVCCAIIIIAGVETKITIILYTYTKDTIFLYFLSLFLLLFLLVLKPLDYFHLMYVH